MDLVPRAHSTGGVVQVPNIYLRFTGSRGQQVGLEWVNIQCPHSPYMLVGLTHQGVRGTTEGKGRRGEGRGGWRRDRRRRGRGREEREGEREELRKIEGMRGKGRRG